LPAQNGIFSQMGHTWFYLQHLLPILSPTAELFWALWCWLHGRLQFESLANRNKLMPNHGVQHWSHQKAMSSSFGRYHQRWDIL